MRPSRPEEVGLPGGIRKAGLPTVSFRPSSAQHVKVEVCEDPYKVTWLMPCLQGLRDIVEELPKLTTRFIREFLVKGYVVTQQNRRPLLRASCLDIHSVSTPFPLLGQWGRYP